MLRQDSKYPVGDFRLIPQTKTEWARIPTVGGWNSFILLFCAILLWAVSLLQIDLRAMNDIGLVSVLPFTFFVSLFILNVNFCLAVSQQPLRMPLLLLHVGVLILMLYGLTAIIEEEPRWAISWKLAGIMDYIMQTGTVNHRIDGFFNWPGFYILMAFVTEIAGFKSPVDFMAWAPFFFNTLYLGPLWMLFRSATPDRRLVMLGIWFFYLANWIGQDYLAPQPFNYFLYLSILAILLTWLRGPSWRPDHVLTWARHGSARFSRLLTRIQVWQAGEEHPVVACTPVQRAAFVSIVIVLLVAMVPSHQLTPFAMLAAISALVIFNRCTAPTLPVLLAVLVFTWLFYMATPFLWGHIHMLTEPMGSMGSNIDANLTKRLRGSPGHILINYMRMGMSLGIWSLACLGGLRRFRHGYRDWGIALLALAPFPLLAMQSYGGELLLRVYLFSLPFAVFLGACLFYPSPTAGNTLRSVLALSMLTFTLLVCFFFTRYGNERMWYVTSEEVAAVRHLYAIAEPGSQLVAATGSLPWRFRDYQTYKYVDEPRLVRTLNIPRLAKIMQDDRYPTSYLILTRGQQASGELFIGWPPGRWEAFEQILRNSVKFKQIYANRDAQIYVLATPCGSSDDQADFLWNRSDVEANRSTAAECS